MPRDIPKEHMLEYLPLRRQETHSPGETHWLVQNPEEVGMRVESEHKSVSKPRPWLYQTFPGGCGERNTGDSM